MVDTGTGLQQYVEGYQVKKRNDFYYYHLMSKDLIHRQKSHNTISGSLISFCYLVNFNDT